MVASPVKTKSITNVATKKKIKTGSIYEKETMIENLPRLPFTATFDNALLTLKLCTGRGDLNCVLEKWFDPIKEHDEAVKKVEEQGDYARELSRVYSNEARTCRNWETVWLIMNERPEELEEYQHLKKKMKDFHEVYESIKDAKAKVEAEQE